MGGREGLVDTAVKTAETGYMQRRLVKVNMLLIIIINNNSYSALSLVNVILNSQSKHTYTCNWYSHIFIK